MNIDFLIETKNEYTTHLCNMITPFIYEGFKKMYNDIAFPKSLPENKELEIEDILYFYQKCLRECKKWNTIKIGNKTIIENEINRINIETMKQGYSYLEDLIKACLKSNLIVLMYNPLFKEQIHIDINYYNDINRFFYILYIEVSRELWCNPYLMYHKYSPLDIKKNQKECVELIKECIKETIRKILPIKHILCNYLKETTNMTTYNNYKLENENSNIINNNNIIQSNLKLENDNIIKSNPNLKLENNNLNIVNNIEKILEATQSNIIPNETNEQNNDIIQVLSVIQTLSEINNNQEDNDDDDDEYNGYNEDNNNELNDNDQIISIIKSLSDKNNINNINNILKDLKNTEIDTSIISERNYKEIFGN